MSDIAKIEFKLLVFETKKENPYFSGDFQKATSFYYCQEGKGDSQITIRMRLFKCHLNLRSLR